MSLHLVTGYAGVEHITSADAGSYNAATIGPGQYVLEMGNQFAASAITNNIVRILDGDILMQGRHIRLEYNTHEDVLIENGSQGMNRNDLIVARYERNSGNGKESVSFIVIRGAETSGTASDPAFIQGNILAGDLINDMPLYRVSLTGISVTAITPLFDESRNLFNTAPASHIHTPSQVGLGNVQNVSTNNQVVTHTAATILETLTSGEIMATAFGKIRKAITDLISHIGNTTNPHNTTASQVGAAASTHNHNASNINAGTLLIERGGTGRSNLNPTSFSISGLSTAGTFSFTKNECYYLKFGRICFLSIDVAFTLTNGTSSNVTFTGIPTAAHPIISTPLPGAIGTSLLSSNTINSPFLELVGGVNAGNMRILGWNNSQRVIVAGNMLASGSNSIQLSCAYITAS